MQSPSLHFWDLLLGEMTIHEWMYSLLMVFIGAFIYIYLRFKNRKDNTTTFSIKIWLSDIDNILAIPFALVLTYLTIRFYANYQDYIVNQLPAGFKSSPNFIMLIGGFCQHWLAEKLNCLSQKL